jgi:hypothetical protein
MVIHHSDAAKGLIAAHTSVIHHKGPKSQALIQNANFVMLITNYN